MKNDKKIITKTFVLQHSASDCGAASLLSLLKFYGGDSTIDHIKKISGTTNTGTTLLGLCQAAREMGFEAQGACADSIDDLIEHGKPCILHLIIENKMSHFVVCYGYENGKFLIGDPGKGVCEMSLDELKASWTMNCLLLTPTDKIEKVESIGNRKKEWILNLCRDDIGLLVSSLVLGLICSVLGLSLSFFTQKLVDDLLPGQKYSVIALGLVFVLIIMGVSVLLTVLRGKINISQSKRFNERSIRMFFLKILKMPKSFFDSHKRGDMIARLNDTRRIQTVISNLISDSIISALIFIANIAFVFLYSWKLALVILACSPVFFWIIARKNKSIISQQRTVMGTYAMCESSYINTLEGVSDIKSNQKQDVFGNMNCNLYSFFQGSVFNLGKTQIEIGKHAGLLSAFVQVGLIAYGCYLVAKGCLTIGALVAVIGISGSCFNAVTKLAVVVIPINEAKVAFERMFEFVDSNKEDETGEIKELSPKSPDTIELNNLSFRFVGRNLLFQNISSKLEKGKITCLVGESGCGKSTICQLLERFYDPSGGEIIADGKKISEFSMNEWRSMVTYVPQDIFIMNGSVLDNICFGESVSDIESINKFLIEYGFADFISSLPHGLMTLVGEEGVKLSGGQKQMIAMARALLVPKPVLILDEITSAMDRKTESFICDLLERIKKDRIIVFVSHRLETVKKIGDKIIVLENGTVNSQGTHQELMASDNFYSTYWKSLMA